MSQFVHTGHVISWSAVQIKTKVKLEVKEDASDEAFSQHKGLSQDCKH
jgi:hypothetical protein